jgi:hypothetical protein
MKKGIFTTFVLLLLLAGDRAKGQNSDHVQWVEHSLSAMQNIKVGMNRAELGKVFVEEGGLSTRTARTYVFKGCQYFKVDVEFEIDPASPSGESPKDRIVKISKPYLAWSTGD